MGAYIFEKKAVGKSIKARTSKSPKDGESNEAERLSPFSRVNPKKFAKKVLQFTITK